MSRQCFRLSWELFVLVISWNCDICNQQVLLYLCVFCEKWLQWLCAPLCDLCIENSIYWGGKMSTSFYLLLHSSPIFLLMIDLLYKAKWLNHIEYNAILFNVQKKEIQLGIVWYAIYSMLMICDKILAATDCWFYLMQINYVS